MKKFILIPIFNEEKNISRLFENLNSNININEFFFVFSNDGSSDDSELEIKKYFKHQEFIILNSKTNIGPGSAFNMGFNWILKQSKDDKDIIITIESDNTSDINILNEMLELNNLGYDLVLASIYAQGGGFEKTSFIRKIISALANLIFRFLFDIKVLTLSSFYRVYNVDIIRKIKNKHGKVIEEYGFISMLEILLKTIRLKGKIIEVPMILKSSNRIGKSKMKILKTTFSYISFLIRNITK